MIAKNDATKKIASEVEIKSALVKFVPAKTEPPVSGTEGVFFDVYLTQYLVFLSRILPPLS